MRLRKTLTETLMLEEVAGEYETRHYDKTASAYMFGYACSSGFGGSGFSGGGGFRRGRAPNSLIEEVCDFEFQYRAGKHEKYGRDHFNIDIISPLDHSILQKIHINWRK